MNYKPPEFPQQEALNVIPEAVCREYLLVPLTFDDSILRIATVSDHPEDLAERVRIIFQLQQVEIVHWTRYEVCHTLNGLYGEPSYEHIGDLLESADPANTQDIGK